MAQFINGNGPAMTQMGGLRTDWTGEVSGRQGTGRPSAASPGREMTQLTPGGPPGQVIGQMDLRHGLPGDIITDPVNAEEVYRGSLKAMLLKYVGNYVVASFLVGTQGMVAWEGVLYDVGNDYVTIYQAARNRYIVSDIYSLKFIEFYDTRCQALCSEVLDAQDWQDQRGR